MVLQAEQKHNVENAADNCVDFAHSFKWFEDSFTQKLLESTIEYWNSDLNVYLLSVTESPNIWWENNKFFVTQFTLAKGLNSQIRISDSLVGLLLKATFGKRDGQGSFKFSTLTELESKVVTSYNDFVHKSIKEFYQNSTRLQKVAAMPDKDYYHLVFGVYPEDLSESGQIIISLPQMAIIDPENTIEVDELPISQFNDCKTPIDIAVGSTRIALDDLRSLESEDIVILESSNIHKMRISGELDINISINPDPKLVMDLDNDEDGGELDMSEEVTPTKNMWDNIQVDVSAEFQKVKLSLGELRQISEGLVVDLASVYSNEITLSVEENTVAKGELVIIGDRYGVKLTQVFKEEQEIIENENPEGSENIEDADTEVEENGLDDDLDDDDFDYSDFEIDDDL